ncbi:hypothetical protein Tco_0507607, partial [Tanacetum coccineum]
MLVNALRRFRESLRGVTNGAEAFMILTLVLVTKPHNKTPYELLTGKFDGKSDEGFLVGYSLNSKAFRPMRSENQAYKNAGPKEVNHST